MPRRRRNRKNKNVCNELKQPAMIKNVDNAVKTVDNLENDVIVRNCMDIPSISKSHIINPLNLPKSLATPSPNIQQNSLHLEQTNRIKSTPVNPNKSINNRHRRDSSRKFHITNLNVLFDSDYAQNLSFDVLSNDSELDPAYKSTPKASTINLQTTASEKAPTVVDTCTQTLQNYSPKFTAAQLQYAITETPKISSCHLLEELSNEAYPDSNYGYNLNNYNTIHQPKISNLNKNDLSDARFNLNPYAQNSEIKEVLRNKSISTTQNKEVSVGELSFFAHNLYNSKLASTPKQNVNSNIGNYMKDAPFRESPKNVVINNESPKKIEKTTSLCVPCTPPQLVKDDNVEKEVFLRCLETQTEHCTINKKRLCRSLTPKLNRYLNHSRLCNKNHTFACQRMHKMMPPRRFTLDLIESGSDSSSSGTCEKIFTRLKRYSRMSAKWSMRVLEICSQLGVTLKKSLTTICQLYSLDKSSISHRGKSEHCKCEIYQAEIENLNVKIGTLNKELNCVKVQLNEHKENRENFLQLSEELIKVKEELNHFREFKKELEALKEQVGCISAMRNSGPIVSQPSSCAVPPPAPPPPPPPPPVPNLNLNGSRQSRTLPRRRERKPSEDVMRPIISLEDILRVKLKKATERPSPLKKVAQPVVSMDMLKQVKLRPASRPQTPASINDASSSCSSINTSPHSSLTRLLSDNTHWRVKRLKRVSGYSFDDLSRRNQMAKRDRTRERMEGEQ